MSNISNLTVSVAMAAYNGEKYIAEQIESILPQLNELDELVISINPSTDRTEEIAREYQREDNRIKLFLCSKGGVLANFENAIRQCKKDIIFLSDQDDVWREGKVETQLDYFKDSTIGGVCHGCKYIDVDGNIMSTQPDKSKDREIKFWEIIKKNPVQGSTLAFRKELRELFLPFPNKIPMHDSWIGLWIIHKRILKYIPDALLLYRQHEGTVTKRVHQNFIKMFKDRIVLFYYLLRYLFNREVIERSTIHHV